MTNFVTVVVFTSITSLCFFWLPASWFKPNLTLLSNRFKHHETDENPSFPPSLAQSRAYSTDCDKVPYSLLSQEFPLLLPVQALWWISQAPKTRLVKTPTPSPTALLQLRLPVKLRCNPSVAPWSNTPGSGQPDPDPIIPMQRRASHVMLQNTTLKSQWNTWKIPMRGQALQLFLLDHVLGTAGHMPSYSIKPCKKHPLNLSWLLMERIRCWCSNPAKHLLIGPVRDSSYGLSIRIHEEHRAPHILCCSGWVTSLPSSHTLKLLGIARM